jgi:dolichyl-phosphate-mannose--protein O-mannosyl transferase
MHHGNMGILQPHPFQSRPETWPLLTGISVAFWRGRGNHEVACRGNAFVYWAVVAALVLCLFALRSSKWRISIKYVFGWCFCYFPFFLIKRSMFLYHYLIPLIIGCMAVGAVLDLYLPRYWVGFFAFAIMLAGFIGFLIWSPFAYGTESYDRKFTVWTDAWIHGRRGN